MKKSFKLYALIWAIMLAAYNVIIFVVRPIIPGFTIVYDLRFWISWAFVLSAFTGNLICAHFAFKAEKLQKLFYRASLISLSFIGVIFMLVFGSVLMLIPNCPAWIAALVCIIVLAINAITVIKAKAAGDAVSEIDENVKAKTGFIKSATAEAEAILNAAKTEEEKTLCKKVYEALRYSDPMSSAELSVIEAKITVKLDEFKSAILSARIVKAEETSDKIISLVNERNIKYKVLK